MTPRVSLSALLVCLLILVLAMLLVPPRACPAAQPPNIVVILTDMQRFDTLWSMPQVQEHLVRRGVNFTQALVTTPLCCPFRASFLSGGYYAHNTGVLNNALPNGGARRFDDTATLPVRLQQAGYATALVGKYLNGYKFMRPVAYVPPGWSRFVALWKPHAVSWAASEFVRGSSTAAVPSVGVRERRVQYQTDLLRDEALAFLDSIGTSAQPFFLYLAFVAPHPPATAALQDSARFRDYSYRGRGQGETDRTDKPAYVQAQPLRSQASVDSFAQKQLRALQAVDRAVAAIVGKVTVLGKRDTTVIIYTSDHGTLWGEHGLHGLYMPYEESIRVPLVLVAPGVPPREDASLVPVNLDVPATLLDLAGIPQATDGLSLMPLLRDASMLWRPDGVLLEYVPPSITRPTLPPLWAGWRTSTAKYVEYATGEKELYNLVADSYELSNVVNEPQSAELAARLKTQLDAQKGLAILTTTLPAGQVGAPYTAQVQAWGGTLPYAWGVEGALPPGISVGVNGTGFVLSGTPVQAGTWPLRFTVGDQSTGTVHGRGQQFVWDGVVVIAGE